MSSQPQHTKGSGEAASSEFPGRPDPYCDAGSLVSTVGMYELCGTKAKETSYSGLFALTYKRRPWWLSVASCNVELRRG